MQPYDLYQADRLPVPGDHTSVAITVASTASTAPLAPGYYSFEPDVDCHIALGPTPSADTTCLWIRSSGGRYQRITETGIYVAVVRAGVTDGTLHINRIG